MPTIGTHIGYRGFQLHRHLNVVTHVAGLTMAYVDCNGLRIPAPFLCLPDQIKLERAK